MSDPQNRNDAGGRDASGRFPKGVSGNPGGKRAMTDEDRKALDELTPEAWARLKKIVNEGDDNVAMKGIREVFDRRYGRSPAAPEDREANERLWGEMLERFRLGGKPSDDEPEGGG